jgi:hypothetical protein
MSALREVPRRADDDDEDEPARKPHWSLLVEIQMMVLLKLLLQVVPAGKSCQ